LINKIKIDFILFTIIIFIKMDLSQSKLTKDQWDFLEKPVSRSELKILKLIFSSRDNINISHNDSKSIVSYMKLNSKDDDNIDNYLFHQYFNRKIEKDRKKHLPNFKVPSLKKNKIKQKDIIRIKNSAKKLKEQDLFENILIENSNNFLNKDYDPHHFYTLTQLIQNNIYRTNKYVLMYINTIIETYKKKVSIKNLIKNAHNYIERNNIIIKYTDVKLYQHQKQLFTITNKNNNFLVLYQAPTGTGKTLSPIGIKKKVIFVCAAKHIGLQLAKSCISLEIPIAMALGCNDVSDIRLHYFAAKEFTRNRRTGGYFRVDNSVGDKVEIIISDIQSYLYAMRYMLAFNDKNNLVWYWDEPTITLDYNTHKYHNILKQNWDQNEIPNIILSSATLPLEKDIFPMILKYKQTFPEGKKYDVISYECKKTIPILDSKGNIAMPHYVYDNVTDLKKSVKHLNDNKTILRYFDLDEISKFISYVNKKKYIPDRYLINNYFDDISNINVINLKLYYLKILSKIKNKPYIDTREYLLKKRKQKYGSLIKITTSDAYTLTDGPTIFLTNNVEKVAKIYLKASNIPTNELSYLMKIIKKNELYRVEIEKLLMEDKEKQDKKNEKLLDKNLKDDSKELMLQEEWTKKINSIKSLLSPVELKKIYVPNSDFHIKEWANKTDNNCFTSDIDEEIIEEIMLLNIRDEWKILLMMGIGVFKEDNDKKYKDIMKKLAENQKLYLIIASTDYIYGTNYQFCHGYLSKDLEDITQEKIIQAFGRIGRRDPQKDYSVRLRDDNVIHKLFVEEEDKKEVKNMNRLFGFN
tara:strand:- start:537 stop:2957 length:2421 start_codon:yes stop_codon:yes gene_type:complete